MTPLTAGRVARRLLAFYQNDPKRWTQGEFARRSDGVPTKYVKNGVCWCAWGALDMIVPDGNSGRVHEAVAVLEEELGKSLPLFNDSCLDFTTFQDGLKKIARLP